MTDETPLVAPLSEPELIEEIEAASELPGGDLAGEPTKEEPDAPAPDESQDKIGRPTIYTDELATEICNRIALGESVRSIVRDAHMPSSSTIFRWLLDETKKPFWEQYEKARNIQAELMFEELLEIADDGSNDWIERENKDGSTYNVIYHEHVQRSRLRVDTRKWYLSKVLPKKFGDKLDLNPPGRGLYGNDLKELDDHTLTNIAKGGDGGTSQEGIS